MREALGLVETRGLSNAILVADAMSKTANISIIGLENSRGLGYMTIKITGDVGAVNAAVTCGKQIAIENNSFVTAKVIPRPSNNIEVTFCQPENKKDNNKEKVIESSEISKENSEKEVPVSLSIPKQKASSIEKSKTKRTRKKAEPKKKEE